MILEATHTHLYAGHRGKISGLTKIADLNPAQDCLVTFSDGAAAQASLVKSDDAWLLDTDAYRTKAGTDIAKKRWLLGLKDASDHVVFRILKSVQD